MTTLIVGGTGKTGLKLARLLREANYPVLITSRSGTAPESFAAVKFDWFDPATHVAPFDTDLNVDKVYLVGPPTINMLEVAKPFIDIGIERGVKWVLLSATQSYKGGPWMGSVHTYLDEKGAGYTVLRPTWFQENFSLQFLDAIKRRNEIFSIAGDGRIPFIAAQDIAQAAFEALTAVTDEYRQAQPYIVGPELYSYDEAAALLSKILGRKIVHKRITLEEMTSFWKQIGLPDDYAAALASIEQRIAAGDEEDAFNTHGGKSVKFVGKKTLAEYFEENKDIWAPLEAGQ